METTKLKIPYSPDKVGHCYDRLPQTRTVFQDGIAEIRRILEQSSPIQDRFREAMTRHQRVLDLSRQEEPNKEFVEEDFYLCCLYDMLEAAVAAESDAILKEPDRKLRDERLAVAREAIASLPFGSPQYRTGIRPRLEKHVKEARKKSDSMK